MEFIQSENPTVEKPIIIAAYARHGERWEYCN